MTPTDSSRDVDNALIDRLKLIEAQPIEQRAEAYGAVLDELNRQLDNAGTTSQTTPGHGEIGYGEDAHAATGQVEN